ncbi:MAG: TrmH family RNA methyltransferase [Leptolyngbyaceae cyanobacterium]
MMLRSPHPAPRHALTLCASLVENPVNLGALCRTAEAFRLQELVLPSWQLLEDREFRKVAVSAHQWQPFAVCPSRQLPSLITEHQQHGTTVVALTRHPQGNPLPTVTFPQQTALLIGRELTGIPSSLIERCDDVVTIPQWGQVESLNVGVAAAIAAYAYVAQHPLEATVS